MLIAGALLVVVGIVLRWWVLRSPHGMLNADEAYTGLEAREILRGRPAIVMGGAVYTGVVDAYVFAPVLAVIGASAAALKLLSSVWWAAAAVGVSWVAFRRVGRLGAGIAGTLMWVAPGPLLVLSTRAYIGYGLGLAAVVATMVIAERELADDAGLSVRRSVALGAASGFAFYCHPMYLTVALPIVAVVAVVRVRAVRMWTVPAIAGAVLVNVPFLAWNVRHDWVSLHQPSPWTEPWIDRLTRFGTGLVPRAFGLRSPNGEWIGPDAVAIAGYLAIVACIVVGATSLVRSSRAGYLIVVPLVVSWPLLALFANLSFVDDARYAIVTWPFLVIALVAGLQAGAARLPSGSQMMRVMPFAAMGLLCIPWLWVNARPMSSDPDVVSHEIIALLDDARVDTLLGNYWFTLPVEYLSDSRISTAVAGHPWGALFEWQPGIPWGVRLPVTQAEVTSRDASRRAYVFQVGDPFLPEADALEVLPLPIDSYVRHDLAGAMLFIPRQDGV